MLLHNVKKRKA